MYTNFEDPFLQNVATDLSSPDVEVARQAALAARDNVTRAIGHYLGCMEIYKKNAALHDFERSEAERMENAARKAGATFRKY